MSIAIERFALLHRVLKYLGPALGTEIGYRADILGGVYRSFKKNAILLLYFSLYVRAI